MLLGQLSSSLAFSGIEDPHRASRCGDYCGDNPFGGTGYFEFQQIRHNSHGMVFGGSVLRNVDVPRNHRCFAISAQVLRFFVSPCNRPDTRWLRLQSSAGHQSIHVLPRFTVRVDFGFGTNTDLRNHVASARCGRANKSRICRTHGWTIRQFSGLATVYFFFVGQTGFLAYVIQQALAREMNLNDTVWSLAAVKFAAGRWLIGVAFLEFGATRRSIYPP